MAKNTKTPRPFGLEFLEPLNDAAMKELNGGASSNGTLKTMGISLPRHKWGKRDYF